MVSKTIINKVQGRQILDSRGNPTLEVDVCLLDGVIGRAAVPSGASTGKREALEKRDGDLMFYGGKGVTSAIRCVEYINEHIRGMDAACQKDIDSKMRELDNTPNKRELGANSILGVSLAVAKAVALSYGLPFFRHVGVQLGRTTLAKTDKYVMPVPLVNVWNGGSHAGWATDIQEYMIVPIGADSFSKGVMWCADVFHTLKDLLAERGYATTVGDEGGFAPLNVKSNEEPLNWIVEAFDKAGYKSGSDMAIALDVAASAFCKGETYFFNYKAHKNGESIPKTAGDLIDFYSDLQSRYPIISIEDGLGEDDWDGWVALTKKLGSKMQINGDDIYVTNTKLIRKGIKLKATNSVLIKPNQIGTLTETYDAINLAMKNGLTAVVSHRSGETEDTIIAHLAVGAGTGQIKTGSMCRGERTSKYNELLRIGEMLGDNAVYTGKLKNSYCFDGSEFRLKL